MKYAQKAVYIYEKTPNHIDRLLAQMYILLAQRTLRTDREGAIKLYLKADSLLTEKDAEKTTNLSFLAYLSREKREIEQSKSAGKSKTPSAAEIALATKAAKIADSFDLVNAGRYFMTLANLNVEANNLCAAIKNCEHSIELYSRSDERYSTPFEISVPSDLLKALYVSGKSFIADGLVEKAIAKVKELHGGESMEYQAQLSSAFGSYSRLENFDAAEAKLNLLLSTKLDLGNWSPPLFGEYRCSWGVGKRELRSSQEVLELISNTLSELAKRKRAAFAIRCFDKLLGAEKAQFGPTDFRVGLTLSHLGRIYHGQGQNSEAEQYFLKALRIFCQNEELKFALTRVQPEYFLTLKKLGKAGTIDLKESELIKDKEAKLRSADKPRRQ